jgi:hypothetical protein
MEVIAMIFAAVTDHDFLTERRVLDEIENRSGKVLTDGWIHRFLARDQNRIG